LPGALSTGSIVGFWGKLPSRGDFLRVGLTRGFVDPWDDWLQAVLPASRAALGEGWLDAWLEAPVWRFALGRNVCGGQAVLGLLLPSVDRAGRYFPLTIAALYPPTVAVPDAEAADEWLVGAEEAALMALETDMIPDALAAMLAALPAPVQEGDGAPGGLWWTDGAPRVAPRRLQTAGLPAPDMFATMLDDGSAS
jgi:type VI secretion system protein ImpM